MSDFTFVRGERLKSRKEIERLFQPGGGAMMQYPLRLVWRPLSERRSQYPVQFTVSVSKRRFKRAPDRNRIKRLLREAYRLHKHELYAALPPDGPQLGWMVVFVGKEIPTYAQTERATVKLIAKFLRKYHHEKK